MIKNIKTYLSKNQEEFAIVVITAAVVGGSIYAAYHYGMANAVGSADHLVHENKDSVILVHLNNGLTKTLVKKAPVA